MVDDVDVCAKGEAPEACDDAERFCVERIGPANSFLEYSRENYFCVGGPGSAISCAQAYSQGSMTDRPTSKAGDAMGENSVMIWKTPSNLRSGAGVTTSTDIRAITLI